jgi:NSS family neurotransmitter:Na+ symporter
VLADFKLFGMNMFDLFDFASSNVLLPLGGISLALFVGWVWGRDNFQRALSNQGALHNTTVTGVVFFLLRYVSPLLILVVMLKGLGLF